MAPFSSARVYLCLVHARACCQFLCKHHYDNDQDRLIHANQTLKNFELSLSFWHDSSESLTCTELFMSTQISLFVQRMITTVKRFSLCPCSSCSFSKKWGSGNQGTITSSGVNLNSLLTGEFCKNTLLSAEVLNTSLRVFTFAGFFPLNSAGLRTRNIWKRREK